ncbi:MAG: hypothetical protein ACK5Q5_11330 [Planctomycetaceae bacterium]
MEKFRYDGQVVRLSDVLARRKFQAAPEMEGRVVLETVDGTLLPILANWRGRTFYTPRGVW